MPNDDLFLNNQTSKQEMLTSLLILRESMKLRVMPTPPVLNVHIGKN
jgi:hypothetical protein